jgi:hypothetical protein
MSRLFTVMGVIALGFFALNMATIAMVYRTGSPAPASAQTVALALKGGPYYVSDGLAFAYHAMTDATITAFVLTAILGVIARLRNR